MSQDMFPNAKQIRAKPRVMMKAIDHGFCDENPDFPELAHMVCKKCSHDAGWVSFSTKTKVQRGEPCPVCNSIQAKLKQKNGYVEEKNT